MAEVKKISVVVETVATITLNNNELKALDALAGYGDDAFLKVFYNELGKAYLQPYEAGLRSFLKAVRNCAHLTKASDECYEFMQSEAAKAVKAGRS